MRRAGTIIAIGCPVRFDRCGGLQVLALRRIDFLLCHEAGPRFGDVVKAFIFEMTHIPFGRDLLELIVGLLHPGSRGPDGCIVLLQFHLQLGNFQNRDWLARCDVRPVIDEQLLHLAGFLGIDVDLLEGHELGRERELLAHCAAGRLHNCHCGFRGCCRRLSGNHRLHVAPPDREYTDTRHCQNF